ncbi:MAG: nucleoside triphosphate pyrophosphohydrolase [Coprothermobacterota bacterium]|nr:nucleoside triphosphate pyrophosphohydrolase [Coprothermobacterota bacterium]
MVIHWLLPERVALLEGTVLPDREDLEDQGILAMALLLDGPSPSWGPGFEQLTLHPPESPWPSRSDLVQFLDFLLLMREMERPVLIGSDRSSALAATYLSFFLLAQGVSLDEAAGRVGALITGCRDNDLHCALERIIPHLLRAQPEEGERFLEFNRVMRALRKRCPWDRQQTHRSLTKYLLEESWELIEAVRQESSESLAGELGDVLLQVVFHAVIAEEKDEFTLSQVLQQITRKLVRRHPHIFNQRCELLPVGVEQQWESIKDKQEQRKEDEAARRYMPALSRAERIQEIAAHQGLDWRDSAGVLEKVGEEWQELQEAVHREKQDQIEEEIGDMLFSLVNLTRFLHLNPEEALHRSIDKFLARSKRVVEIAGRIGKETTTMSLEELDRVWEKAKKEPQTE